MARLWRVSLQPAFPGRDSSQPEAYVSLPYASEFSPLSRPQTLPEAAAQLQVKLGLPSKYSAATVSVTAAAGGQRILAIEYDQPKSAYASDNLSELVNYADSEQAALDGPLGGGNIGQVVVQSRDTGFDSATGTYPLLFVHAADVTWGQKFEWAAPSVRAFTDLSAADSAPASATP